MTTHGKNGAFPHDPDADRLGAAWNDLVTETQPDVDDRDAELFEVVRALHRGAPIVTPDARFKANLKEHIMTSAASLATASEINRRPLRDLLTLRRAWAIPERPRTSSRLFPALISAAMLLATLGAAGYWSLNRDGSGDNTGGPVIYAPASPSPEAARTIETFYEITLAADVIPADALGTMLLSWDTIPANSVTSHEGLETDPAAKIYFVIEGSVTIEGDGPIQVVRHDGAGAVENYAAGEPADLGLRDLVVVRNEDTQTWTTGVARAEVIIGTLGGGSTPQPESPSGWPYHVYTVDYHSLELPGGPYLLTLREVSVESETAFELPENGLNQLAIVHEGRAMVGKGGDGVIRVIELYEPSTLFVLTLLTTSEGAGTPVAGMGTATAATPEP
jgi:hypothetical protein